MRAVTFFNLPSPPLPVPLSYVSVLPFACFLTTGLLLVRAMFLQRSKFRVFRHSSPARLSSRQQHRIRFFTTALELSLDDRQSGWRWSIDLHTSKLLLGAQPIWRSCNSKVIINGTDSYCRRQELLLSHTFSVQTPIPILKAHLL